MNALMTAVFASPQRCDVREVFDVVLDCRIGHGELAVSRSERESHQPLAEVLERHLDALHHGVKARQALLPVDDELGRGQLLAVPTDEARIDVGGIPEHQITDREAPVHAVQEITNCGGLPNERPLQLRKGELP
jgi:hypothetical protein